MHDWRECCALYDDITIFQPILSDFLVSNFLNQKKYGGSSG
jgi:hypothetical protein